MTSYFIINNFFGSFWDKLTLFGQALNRIKFLGCLIAFSYDVKITLKLHFIFRNYLKDKCLLGEIYYWHSYV